MVDVDRHYLACADHNCRDMDSRLYPRRAVGAAYPHTHLDGDLYVYADSNADLDIDRNADPDADHHLDANADANRYTCAHRHSYRNALADTDAALWSYPRTRDKGDQWRHD